MILRKLISPGMPGHTLIIFVLLAFTFVLPPAAAADNSIRIAFSRETDFIDRLHTDSMESAALSLAVYDTLLYRDPVSGHIRGLLAESWSWNHTQDAIEFTLRNGVRFHNGEPLNADDVLFTINLLTDPANDVHFRQRESSFGFIESAEKLDEFRVIVRLKQPSPLAEHIFATRLIIWPRTYTQSNGGHLIHRTAPVGTGPYQVETIEPGKQSVLTANRDYFNAAKPAASVDRLIVSTVPDLQTQIAELLQGSLDFIWGVPADHARLLGAYSRLTVSYADSARITFLSINASGRNQYGLLTDLGIRQAVDHAIDRESITTNLMAARAEPLYYQCHPAQQHCLSGTRASASRFDPHKAKYLLQTAGYDAPVHLDIMLGSDELRKVGEVLQWQLQQVGIGVSLRTYTLPAWRKKFMAGESAMSLVSYGGDLFDVAATLPTFFTLGPADYARDPVLARMVRLAGSETEPGQRTRRFEEALKYISEQVYTVPLYTNPVSFVFHSDLSYEAGMLPFPDMTRLRLSRLQEN